MNIISKFAPSSTDESPLVGLVNIIESKYASVSYQSDKLVEHPPIPKETFIFNQRGEKVEHVLYAEDGSIRLRFTYAYNSGGNLAEVMIYKDNSILDSKVIYSYDHKGNCTDNLRYKDNDSLIEKVVYTYDRKGILSEKSAYDAKGSLKWVSLYTHDLTAALRREETIYYEPSGDIAKKSISVDSANGRLTESSIHNADGTLRHRMSCSFDPISRREIERAWYGADGSLEWKWLYAYDAGGNLIEGACYSESGWQKYLYRYEFDSVGNWISRIKMKLVSLSNTSSFIPYEVIHRIISYWP